MPHFFINKNSINDKKIIISDKENYNHIARALHTKIGEKLLFIDENKIQYETVVEKITSSTLIANILNEYPSKRFLPINLYLAQAVLKKEAQAEAIQKACELGVKGIYPMITDNCTIKKSYAIEKIEKYNKLSYEASKQCERPDIAEVYNVTDLKSMLNSTEFNIKIACVEKNSKMTLKSYLSSLSLTSQDKILVIIGPEGGFEEKEVEEAFEIGGKVISLGKRILRTETAAITSVAICMLYSEMNLSE